MPSTYRDGIPMRRMRWKNKMNVRTFCRATDLEQDHTYRRIILSADKSCSRITLSISNEL